MSVNPLKSPLAFLAVLFVGLPLALVYWQVALALAGIAATLYMMWYLLWGQHRELPPPPLPPNTDLRTLTEILGQEEAARVREKVGTHSGDVSGTAAFKARETSRDEAQYRATTPHGTLIDGAENSQRSGPQPRPELSTLQATLSVEVLREAGQLSRPDSTSLTEAEKGDSYLVDPPSIIRPEQYGGPRKPAPPTAGWVPLGETIKFQGSLEIKGGGYYYGSTGETSHASLVDPSLLVRTHAPDWKGSHIGFYPTYRALLPNQRGAYLGFLNSDRSSRGVAIPYAFIYFYGIERRLLVDLPGKEDAREEVVALLAEVVRLRECYGNSQSFTRYANELVRVASHVHGIDPHAEVDPGHLSGRSLEVQLGQFALRGDRLPSRLAIDWGKTQVPSATLRANECVWAEAEALFQVRYAASYGPGLLLKPSAARPALPYVWAAPGMGGAAALKSAFPGVQRAKSHAEALGALLQQCIADLAPLKRARNAKVPSVLSELAAVPAELRGKGITPALSRLPTLLEARVPESGGAELEWRDLARWCDMDPDDPCNKREATTLSLALESLGYGIEPDVRFFGSAPTDTVQLFRLLPNAEQAPSEVYATVLLMLHAALAVGEANGESSSFDADSLLGALERQVALSPSERARLEAHLKIAKRSRLSIRVLEKRLAGIAPEGRKQLAQILVDVANADGQITPEEVRVLERLYVALQLDPADVASHLHRASVGQSTTGPGTAIDAQRVAQKLAETARVQAVLAEIFREDEPVAPSVATPSVPSTGAFGLDAAHAVLLDRLLAWADQTLERSTWDDWCGEVGLMPSGALEQINSIAFDSAGEALAEDGDPLEISEYARETLRAAVTMTP